MILNKAQAEAAYSAMCALNNVSGVIDVRIPIGVTVGRYVRVYQLFVSNTVRVSLYWGGSVGGHESHADQKAFAIAYGLE